jgi:tripartite-type tricarboxylate transporter receptor subunit TctC
MEDYSMRAAVLEAHGGNAGGLADIFGRILANAMTKTLGQTVYVENRGGAGGTIGAGVVAKSAPDGYTILMTSAPMIAIAPLMIEKLPYDAVEDFTPIGTVATTSSILVVTPSLPVKTMSDLIAYGKAQGKDKLSFASAGPGSTGQILGHILETAMGTTMVDIPYKSPTLAYPDAFAGRVSIVFDFVSSAMGFIQSGSVRPIVVMSEVRSPLLPDVPTAAEAGLPGATMLPFWLGIEGPPKMAPAIVEKLNAAIKASVTSQAMRDQLAKLGAIPLITSPEEFNMSRRRDVARLRQFAKEIGLRPK